MKFKMSKTEDDDEVNEQLLDRIDVIVPQNDWQPELQCECGDGTQQLDGNRSHNMTKLNNSTINVSSACDVLKVLCRIFFIMSTADTEIAKVWRQSPMRVTRRSTRNVRHGECEAKEKEIICSEVCEVNCVCARREFSVGWSKLLDLKIEI